MKRLASKEIIKKIIEKAENGYVLDENKYASERITYHNKNLGYDSVFPGNIPCLVKCTGEDDWGVDFLTEEETVPLKDRVGFESMDPYRLSEITSYSLQHILDAMVKP